MAFFIYSEKFHFQNVKNRPKREFPPQKKHNGTLKDEETRLFIQRKFSVE